MKQQRYVPALDGVRGIAILGVLLAHTRPASGIYTKVTELGTYGVTLFLYCLGF
jgi:peptidoglycan/LPS O-acetylase OafA/YrhL